MRKSLLRIVTILSIVALCFGFASCKDEPTLPSGEETVSINRTSLSLVLGDSELLSAEFTGGEEQVLRWSSEDPSVVSVDENGQLTANDVGATVIKATYGSAVAKCSVNVTLGDFMPTLDINTLGQTQLSVSKSETIDLSGKILFNGKTYHDATIIYEVEDEAVGMVTDGIFYPADIGTTRVTVVAHWKGCNAATLTKTYEISVDNNVVFIVNGGITDRVELFTAESHYGREFDTEMPFVAEVEVNGANLGEITPVVADQTIVKYENGKLIALRYGNTTVSLQYTDGTTPFVRSIPVVIERPLAEYNDTFTLFSVTDGDGKGEINFESVFGAGYMLSEATQNGKELTVSADGKKVLGGQTSSSEMTETQLTVFTEECGFTFNVQAYTKVLTAADDLDVFDITMEKVREAFTKDDGVTSGTVTMGADADNTYYVDGYYYLANDIDASGKVIKQSGLTLSETIDGVTYNYSSNGDTTGVFNESKYIGFKGVFEGAGHTISGLTLGRAGLFGNLCAGSNVLNVAFTDVKLTAQDADKGSIRGGNVLACHIQTLNASKTTIENIYIKLASQQYTRGVLAYDFRGTGYSFLLNNVVIDCPDLVTRGATIYGSLFGDIMSIDADNDYTLNALNGGNIQNVHVISGVTLTKVTDMFAIYGANEEAPTDLGVNETIQLTGVYRYATREEWVAATGIDYSSFTDSGYWTLGADGVPVFGNN